MAKFYVVGSRGCSFCQRACTILSSHFKEHEVVEVHVPPEGVKTTVSQVVADLALYLKHDTFPMILLGESRRVLFIGGCDDVERQETCGAIASLLSVSSSSTPFSEVDPQLAKKLYAVVDEGQEVNSVRLLLNGVASSRPAPSILPSSTILSALYVSGEKSSVWSSRSLASAEKLFQSQGEAKGFDDASKTSFVADWLLFVPANGSRDGRRARPVSVNDLTHSAFFLKVLKTVNVDVCGGDDSTDDVAELLLPERVSKSFSSLGPFTERKSIFSFCQKKKGLLDIDGEEAAKLRALFTKEGDNSVSSLQRLDMFKKPFLSKDALSGKIEMISGSRQSLFALAESILQPLLSHQDGEANESPVNSASSLRSCEVNNRPTIFQLFSADDSKVKLVRICKEDGLLSFCEEYCKLYNAAVKEGDVISGNTLKDALVDTGVVVQLGPKSKTERYFFWRGCAPQLFPIGSEDGLPAPALFNLGARTKSVDQYSCRSNDGGPESSSPPQVEDDPMYATQWCRGVLDVLTDTYMNKSSGKVEYDLMAKDFLMAVVLDVLNRVLDPSRKRTNPNCSSEEGFYWDWYLGEADGDAKEAHDHRLRKEAFLFNLYNILVTLKMAMVSGQSGCKKLAQSSMTAQYHFFYDKIVAFCSSGNGRKSEVSLLKFSLDELENGLLRGNRMGVAGQSFLGKLMTGGLGPFGKTQPPSLNTKGDAKREERGDEDLRGKWAIPREVVDYRLHSALNCGAFSCPPVRSFIHDPARGYYISHSLDKAFRGFVASSTKLQNESSSSPLVLVTSMIMKWYMEDMQYPLNSDLEEKAGGRDEESLSHLKELSVKMKYSDSFKRIPHLGSTPEEQSVLEVILHYLGEDHSITKQVSDVVGKGGRVEVVYEKYDWGNNSA